GDGQCLALRPTQNLELKRFIKRMEIQSRGEGRQGADRAAIGADYYIADLQAASLSRTSRDHVIDHDSPILCEPQSFGQVLIDRLSACLDLDAMHVPILAQALVHET